MARIHGRQAAAAALLTGLALVASPTVAQAASGSPTPAPTASGEQSSSVIGGEQLGRSGTQVNLGSGAAPLPDIWASSWVLADATTGEVLAAKKAHLQRPPASTLKTLTAVTVIPRLPLSTTYVAKASDPVPGTASAGVVPGVTYTVKQLLNGMMLPSGNDAARALAHANGGIDETLAQMNATAAALGARDTVAKSPNGLDKPGQVSSAYDLVLIGRAALANPDIAGSMQRTRAKFPTTGGAKKLIYSNNHLLLSGYKGTVGIKTGYTTEAGRTFIGAATRKGHTLIVALMGIKGGSAPTAAAALSWGFKNLGKVTPVGTLVTAGELPAVEPRAQESSSAAAVMVPSGPPAEAALTMPDVPRTSWPPVIWYSLAVAAVVAVFAWLWFRRRSRRSPYSIV